MIWANILWTLGIAGAALSFLVVLGMAIERPRTRPDRPLPDARRPLRTDVRSDPLLRSRPPQVASHARER